MNKKEAQIRKPRICFVHIPKTAGTSITSCLQNFYSPKQIAPGNTMLDYKKLSKEELKKYLLYKGHIYYSFAKENLPSDTIYITIIREPVERVLSLYKFWASHSDDFFQNPNIPDIIKHGPKMAKTLNFLSFVKSEDSFIVQSTRNNQLQQLSKLNNNFTKKANHSKDIISNLSEFAVVGVLDFVSFFAYEVNQFTNEKIFNTIPKQNVSAKNKNYFEGISDDKFKEAVEIVKQNNSLEIQVYNYFKDEVKKRINQFFIKEINERS